MPKTVPWPIRRIREARAYVTRDTLAYAGECRQLHGVLHDGPSTPSRAKVMRQAMLTYRRCLVNQIRRSGMTMDEALAIIDRRAETPTEREDTARARRLLLDKSAKAYESDTSA